MGSDPYRQSVPLNVGKRAELLNRLDKATGGAGAVPGEVRASRRKHPRWQYRQSDILLTVEHSAGGASRLLVCARNLSAGGISFLHGGYLYPGSRCIVILRKFDRQKTEVTAVVVNCRHVEGIVHEVGLKFDHRVEPRMFLQTAQPRVKGALDALELPNLRGRVLYIDDSETEQMMLAHHLQPTGVHLTMASDAPSALAQLAQEPIDIVLCVLDLGGESGAELIRKMRGAHFQGPIVLVTAETDDARIAEARQAGADQLLSKPYAADELLALLGELHQQVGALASSDLMYSSTEDQAGMPGLIAQYIEHARQVAEQLQRADEAEELPRVRTLCLDLKGSAPGVGFARLGDLANEALHLLDTTGSLNAAAAQIKQLRVMCERLGLRCEERGEEEDQAGRPSV